MSEQALEPRTKSLTHPALRPHELFGAQDAPCVDGLPLGNQTSGIRHQIWDSRHQTSNIQVTPPQPQDPLLPFGGEGRGPFPTGRGRGGAPRVVAWPWASRAFAHGRCRALAAMSGLPGLGQVRFPLSSEVCKGAVGPCTQASGDVRLHTCRRTRHLLLCSGWSGPGTCGGGWDPRTFFSSKPRLEVTKNMLGGPWKFASAPGRFLRLFKKQQKSLFLCRLARTISSFSQQCACPWRRVLRTPSPSAREVPQVHILEVRS